MLLAASAHTLSWADTLWRVGLAAVLGAAIGFERELHERQAGLRTHLLVAVGAALFTLAGAYGFEDFTRPFDPTRVAAQIVTGVGFLGAGAILRQGLSVKGLTTAATLWVVAAIGLAAGAGFYSGAVITTVLVLVSLWPLRIVARRGMRRFRAESEVLVVSMPSGKSPGGVISRLEEAGGKVDALEISHEGDRRHVAIEVELPQGSHAKLIAAVADVEGVLDVRWSE